MNSIYNLKTCSNCRLYYPSNDDAHAAVEDDRGMVVVGAEACVVEVVVVAEDNVPLQVVRSPQQE